MKLYRICTEATGVMETRAIDAMLARFPGFTVLHSIGYWRGGREYSLVLEYIGADSDRATILDVARDIRAENKQQAVCVQILDAELVSVTE